MIIRFQIEYKTFPGQQLLVCGSIAELGGGNPALGKTMSLQQTTTGTWTLSLETTYNEFTYRYYVKDDNFNTFLEEWGTDRSFNSSGENVLLLDRWRALSDPEFALRTSAFQKAILKREKTFNPGKARKEGIKNPVKITFNPDVIRLKPEHRVAVCGSAAGLGHWDEKKALKLGNTDHPVWNGEVYVDVSEFPVKYKYLIYNEKGKPEFWEQSGDRVINLPKNEIPDAIVVHDEKFEFPRFPWKGAGVAIPVFSLRRRDGFGVGEFTDIRLLVDWAVAAGMKMVQILPVNDTVARHTWQDSYPYAAISVFALHPVYINLLEIGKLEADITQEIIEARGAFLNGLDKIDYEAVMALKSRFFKLIYDQKKQELFKNDDFLEFFNINEYWLKPYAAFSYLRDLFDTPDFSQWGEYSLPTLELLSQLTDTHTPHYDDIAVHYFIQYYAHKQLLEAAEYARARGIVLKGDIPIGIYRNSVDAWLNPHLYHMDCQAGAPPDDFSNKGQNWRFPTYNWEEMARDNYAWWQQRLRQLSYYFDAFRIDHILGFFRIWEIPVDHVEGLMGYFNPSIPYYRDELQNRGLWMDEDRLCNPYIREHFLYERFGDLTSYVKENFLVEYMPGCFHLHPDYNTQRKVEIRFKPDPDASPEMRSRLERISMGLYSLISEVIFLKAPGTGGHAFYPRNALHFTRSYQELDQHSKHIINEIYLDYFYHRNEEFWRSKAMTKLPVIKKATDMLLCGEDLGMVPACVPSVMNELGILSLEVQRMPKDPKVTFGHPANYPYLSVATPSSHDTSTVRGWWEENPAFTQKFYNEILGNYGQAPFFCNPDIVKQIIVQHLYSPSMWAVFPLQDLLGMNGQLRLENPHAERINQPGNPNHYWRYRMHISLEDLIEQYGFNSFIKGLIRESGRLDVY